jgi:hypothetical protein
LVHTVLCSIIVFVSLEQCAHAVDKIASCVTETHQVPAFKVLVTFCDERLPVLSFGHCMSTPFCGNENSDGCTKTLTDFSWGFLMQSWFCRLRFQLKSMIPLPVIISECIPTIAHLSIQFTCIHWRSIKIYPVKFWCRNMVFLIKKNGFQLLQ